MFSHNKSIVKAPALILFACLLGLSNLCFAQSAYPAVNPVANQTGLPTGASFEGTTEAVNLNNGNVNVSLPLITLKGMELLELNLSLIYDSKVYVMHGGQSPQPQSDGTTSYTYPQPNPPTWALPFAGGRIAVPSLTSDIVNIPFNIQGNPCGYDCPPDSGGGTHGSLACQARFVFTDWGGAQHSFTNFPPCENSQVTPIYIDDVADGSLLRLDTTNLKDVVVSDRSGLQYHFNLSSSGLPFQINDLNGNKITITHSGTYPNPSITTITDTQNRIVTISSTDISYRDSSGAVQRITATPFTTAPDVQSFQVNYCRSSDGGYVSQGGSITGQGNGAGWNIQFPASGSYSTGPQYSVTLNSLSEVTKIGYPGGGYTSYIFQNIPSTYVDDNWKCSVETREIRERHVCSSTSGNCTSSAEAITKYTADTSGTNTALDGNVTMEVTDPLGNVTRHIFNEQGWPSQPSLVGSKETDTIFYSGVSTEMARVHNDYGSGNSQISSCSQPGTITTTHIDGSVTTTAQVTLEHQSVTLHPGTGNEGACYVSDNVTKKSEFDYSGQLIRVTSQSWLSSDSGSAGHLLDRLTDVTIADSASNPGFYSHHGIQYDARGNITGETHSGTNAISTAISTPRDAYGRPISLTDARGMQTTYDYSPAWNGTACQPVASAFPKVVSNPLQQATTFSYNPCTGTINSVTDPNGAQTTYAYDALGRMISTSFADGGFTSVDYNPSAGSAVTTKRASSAGNLVSVEKHDGVGRSSSIQQSSPEGTIQTDITWDPRGQRASVSNPYIGSSTGATTYAYDALGRIRYKCNPDNVVPGCSPGQSYIEWVYSGNQIERYDEARHHSRLQSDAIGRLTDVWEPNSANAPTLHTQYSYNVLGSLTSVDQFGDGSITEHRSFTYDGLNRLTTSSNAENGTICYGQWSNNVCGNGYDANGNLTAETDARGAVTSYSYDALNRLTDRNYSDGTPGKHFQYDQTSNWMGPQYNTIGRVSRAYTDPDTRVFNGGSKPVCGPQTSSTANANPASGNPVYCNWSDHLYSYDAVGRVARIGSATPSEAGWAAHEVDMLYDVLGNMTSLRYPDGRVVTQDWDSAGRLSKVTYDSVNGQHVGSTFATAFAYTPAGAQSEITLGNGVIIHNPYNNRQQICQTWVFGPNSWWFDKHYMYGDGSKWCDNTPGNNGNIAAILDMRNNNLSQGFSYDTLNRLASFSNGDGTVQETYTYDPFGNMNQSGTFTSNLTFDQNNRIKTGAYGYDAAGNIVAFNNSLFTTHYAYDAAGELFRTDAGNGYYTYNANGERVRKDASGSFTEYDYLNGQPIAEKDATGAWTDYVYANGKRIASLQQQESVIQVAGSYSGGWKGVGISPAAPALGGYVFRSGDVLNVRQRKFGQNVHGGILIYGNGTGSYFNDQDGQRADDDTLGDGSWHNRIIPLDGLAGKTYSGVSIGGGTSTDYNFQFASINVSSVDGTVRTIFNGGPASSTTMVGTDSNSVHYFVSDHLGTAQLDTSASGAPLSVSQFAPFGQQFDVNTTQNHYKFTGKERDTESGLDYFGARYYGSSMGRFMSPDWADKPEAVPYSSLDNPQSLNLYGYVNNNPLSKADRDGHAPDILVIEDGPTQGNPIGHTAIAVTGYGVFSFGTNTPLGSSVTDFLKMESGRRDQTITIVKTTPEQDQAAVSALQHQNDKGAITLYPDNCSARTNAALDAAGVPPIPPSVNPSNGTILLHDQSIPGSAGERAQQTRGSQTVVIPKNSAKLPANVDQFNPRGHRPPPPQENQKPHGSS